MYRDQWIEWARPLNAELDRAYDFLSTDDLELARVYYEAAEDCDEKHIGLAVVSILECKVQDAKVQARKAISIDDPYRSENVVPLVLLGDFFMLCGQREGALITYENALELDQDNPDVLCRIGELAFQNEDYDGAAVSIRRAYDLDKNSVDKETYGEICYRAGYCADSLLVFKDLLIEDEFNSHAWLRYAQSMMRLSEDNAEKARKSLNEAIAFGAGLEANYERACTIYSDVKSGMDPMAFEEAMDDLELIETTSDDDGLRLKAFMLHGELLGHRRKYDASIEKYWEAIDINFCDADSWYAIAECKKLLAQEKGDDTLDDESEKLLDIAEILLAPNDDDWLELEATFNARQEPERALLCSIKLAEASLDQNI
jgi:tetratricopeptide (TPR) repeat protein